MNTKIKSMMILFLASIVWGFAFVAQRLGGNIGTYTFNALRFALGAVSLIPVIKVFEKDADKQKAHKTIKPGILCGIFLFTASTFQQYGVVVTDYAGKSGFITDFYIILVPIFAMILFKEKVNKQALIGAVISIIGFYFLCINQSLTICLGDILLFVCAIFFAFHILAIDHFANNTYPLRLSLYQFATCSILSFIASFIFESYDIQAIKMAIIPILYGGIMSVGVGYTLQTIGQKDMDSTTSAIILSLESVFCSIGSVIFLKEVMTLQGYIGCILVFIGIIIAQLPSKTKTG